MNDEGLEPILPQPLRNSNPHPLIGDYLNPLQSPASPNVPPPTTNPTATPIIGVPEPATPSTVTITATGVPMETSTSVSGSCDTLTNSVVKSIEPFTWVPKDVAAHAVLITLPVRIRSLFDTLHAEALPECTITSSTGVALGGLKAKYMAYAINQMIEETIVPTLSQLQSNSDAALVTTFHVSWGLFYDALLASRGVMDPTTLTTHSQRLEQLVPNVVKACLSTKKRTALKKWSTTRKVVAKYAEGVVTAIIGGMLALMILTAVLVSEHVSSGNEVIIPSVALGISVLVFLAACAVRWSLASINETHERDHKVSVTLAKILNELVAFEVDIPLLRSGKQTSSVWGSRQPNRPKALVTVIEGNTMSNTFNGQNLEDGDTVVISPPNPLQLHQTPLHQQQNNMNQFQPSSRGMATPPSQTVPTGSNNKPADLGSGTNSNSNSYAGNPEKAHSTVSFAIDSSKSARRASQWSGNLNYGSLVIPLMDFKGTQVRCSAESLYDRVIIIVLTESLHITIWDEAAVQATGFTEYDALGKNFAGLLATEQSHNKFKQLVKTATSSTDNGLDSMDEDIVLFHAQLGVMTIRINVRMAYTTQGDRFGYVLIGSTNSTSQRDNAFRTEKLINTVSQHYHQQIMSTMDVDQMKDTTMSMALQTVGSCLNLAQPDVLQLISDAMPYYTIVHISRFVGEVVADDEIADLMERRRTMISSDIDMALPEHVRIDEARLGRALTDVVKFVAHECPAGVHVSLKLQQNEMAPGVHTLEFTVSRPGAGVTPYTIALMRSVKAVSMGCYEGQQPTMSHNDSSGVTEQLNNLVKAHNAIRTMSGWLTVVSSIKEMSMKICVPLWLPEHRANSIFSSRSSSVSEDSAPTKCDAEMHGHLTFLLMEDSTIYRFSLSQMTWDEGHAVLLAMSIEDAIAILHTGSPPHAILIDSTISGVLSLIQEARKAFPDLFLVWTTEHPEFKPPPVPDMYVLRKPFRASEYKAMITEIHTAINRAAGSKEQIAKVREIFTEHNACPWQRGECIGSGRFGKVYAATDTLTGGRMAVKIIPIDVSDPNSTSTTMELLNEIDVMRKLEYEHILHYFYCEKSPSAINIFMEFADGGSLAGVLENNGALDPQQIAAYIAQLLKAVSYIHKRHIVHRDIKAGNILLSRGSLKLGDFGSAKTCPEGTQIPAGPPVGTIRWMAPEIMKGEPYDWHADIWSIGCTVVEMATAKAPWAKFQGSSFQIMSMIMSLEGTCDGGAPNLPGLLSSFVALCLNVDPTKRPNADTLLTQPFVTNTNVEELRMAAYQCKEPLQRRKSKHARRQSAYSDNAGEFASSNSSVNSVTSSKDLNVTNNNSSTPTALPTVMRRKSRRISAWDDDDDDSSPSTAVQTPSVPAIIAVPPPPPDSITASDSKGEIFKSGGSTKVTFNIGGGGGAGNQLDVASSTAGGGSSSGNNNVNFTMDVSTPSLNIPTQKRRKSSLWSYYEDVSQDRVKKSVDSKYDEDEFRT